MALEDDIRVIFELLKEFLGGLKTDPKQRGSANFQVPIQGSFKNSGGFDPTGKGSVGRPHFGLDLRISGGSGVFPIADGVVKYVRPDPKGGNTILIDHQNGYTSYYAHLGTIGVFPGQRVSVGEEIATVGASGNARGFPHLHLQIWNHGQLIDPASVLSVPPYTPYNPQKERLWLPGAKEQADSWNLSAHLAKARNQRIG